MSDFWKSFDLPLINYEIELDLTWSEDFMLSQIFRTATVATNSPNSAKAETETTGATFQITSARL